MALRGTTYFTFAVICHISFYGTYLTPVSCSSTEIYPSSESSSVVSSTSTSISTISTSEELSIVPSTLQTTEVSSVVYLESATATPRSSDRSDYKSLEASEIDPSSQPTSDSSNYESLETSSYGPSSQKTPESSNYESLEATESGLSLEVTSASPTGAPSVTFESGSVSEQSVWTSTSTPFFSETMMFSTSSQEVPLSTPLYSSLDGSLLTMSVSPTVNTLSTEDLNVTESSMKSAPSTDTDMVETSTFVDVTSTPVMTEESTTPLQTSESNEALPSMPTTSLYSQSTATSEPLSTVAITGGPDVTTEMTTEDQGTNSTKVVYQFNRTMLLISVGLICGTGVVIVFIIIGHRCRVQRGGHTLEKETDEILPKMEKIESSTDVTDVDLSLVESVAINVALPPPPPPPPPIILEPTEDLLDPDYVCFDDDGNQVTKRNGDLNNERLRPDYFSYHDNGNVHMRTFKGSARKKNRTQSWAAGRSLDRDEENSSKVVSDEKTLVNKETLL